MFKERLLVDFEREYEYNTQILKRIKKMPPKFEKLLPLNTLWVCLVSPIS
jgi:hypothetical protein